MNQARRIGGSTAVAVFAFLAGGASATAISKMSAVAPTRSTNENTQNTYPPLPPQNHKRKSEAVSVSKTGSPSSVAQILQYDKPKWQTELEQRKDLINLSLTVDNSGFDGEHHYIHSIKHPGKFEHYEVFLEPEAKTTHAVVRLGKKLCGHNGIVHGGCTATIMDELFGWTFYSQKLGPGFTANLNINYRKPIPAETTVLVRTSIEQVEGRKVHMVSAVEDGSGNIYSDAKALFVIPRSGVISAS